jgi:hypothetical protein
MAPVDAIILRRCTGTEVSQALHAPPFNMNTA